MTVAYIQIGEQENHKVLSEFNALLGDGVVKLKMKLI